MFLRDAFRFWFRPVFGFNIAVGTAMAIGGGLNFLGGLFGSRSKRKAQKAANALQREQLNMERERRQKLLGLANDYTGQALQRYRKAATYDDLFAAGTEVQGRLAGANEARLSFIDDLMSGQQYDDRLSGYAPLGTAILDAGLAERNAIEEAYAQIARARNMRQVNKFGGGGFAADIAAARDKASNLASANLAYAKAVEKDAATRFGIFEDNLKMQDAGLAKVDDIARRATLFDVMPQQLAFSTDLANLSDAYKTAGTMMAPYSFYAGAPMTNFRLDATGTSPVGDALTRAGGIAADYGALKVYQGMGQGGGSGGSPGLTPIPGDDFYNAVNFGVDSFGNPMSNLSPAP